MSSTISPFDNFNAKYSTEEEIASTFVSNNDFFTISKSNHTFVIGPRGCGKTTIFKMLTYEAQSNWIPKSIREKELKDNFPFIGIYIPSDDLWKDQIESFKKELLLTEELSEFIDLTLSSINILMNFCSNIYNIISILKIDRKEERIIEYSNHIIRYWGLSKETFSNLRSIENELGLKKSNFIKYIRKKYSIFNANSSQQNDELDSFYYFDFLTEIKNAILLFEQIFDFKYKPKWALCFDELELVSPTLSKLLLQKLRVAPQNILFKLSSGPLTEFSDTIAQVIHDYEIVKMWPFNHKEEEEYGKFCEEIAIERIRNFREVKNLKKHLDIDFDNILKEIDYGNYVLKDYNFQMDHNAKEDEAYSLTWWIFKKAAELDKGISAELDKRGINPENPIPRTKSNYDSFIRKVKEIVINRLVFTKHNSHKSIAEKRTRKVYPIYYGKKTIFKICEGNPRFIMNIIDELIIKSNKYINIAEERIPPSEQTDVIKKVSKMFVTMLKSYPTYTRYGNMNVDLSWLINELGRYFEAEINSNKFKINPETSFKFNKKKCNPEILRLIEKGVSLGAFIRIDDEGSIEHSSDHTRYRLSYLLHPNYKLPLRLYSSTNLFNIIPEETQLNLEI